MSGFVANLFSGFSKKEKKKEKVKPASSKPIVKPEFNFEPQQQISGDYFDLQQDNIAPMQQQQNNYFDLQQQQSDYSFPNNSNNAYPDIFSGFVNNGHGHGEKAFIREIEFPDQEVNTEDEIVAIIVTICDGNSYDQLFNTVPQQSPEGTRVKTYSCNSAALRALDALWNQQELEDVSEQTTAVINQLNQELAVIDPECVVFNWECCSCYSKAGFNQPNTIPFIKTLIDKKFMVMCSDFSLKALIREWDTDILGPNPFKQIGEFGDQFVLRFESKTLVDCPSSQLQQVGELCEDGKAEVHAMSGTIAYNVDFGVADNSSYSLEILTIAQSMRGVKIRDRDALHIGDESGAAGHVILKYPSGGQLLTSSGHWLELSKLNVDVDRFLAVAKTNTDDVYYTAMYNDIQSSATFEERQRKCDTYANVYGQASFLKKVVTSFLKKVKLDNGRTWKGTWLKFCEHVKQSSAAQLNTWGTKQNFYSMLDFNASHNCHGHKLKRKLLATQFQARE